MRVDTKKSPRADQANADSGNTVQPKDNTQIGYVQEEIQKFENSLSFTGIVFSKKILLFFTFGSSFYDKAFIYRPQMNLFKIYQITNGIIC